MQEIKYLGKENKASLKVMNKLMGITSENYDL